jgi:3-oxocholest-4-en-26-oate---CoA ligase
MAIKGHPSVYDALVVGVPDDKYGQAVAAVVELREGETVDLEGLRTHLRPLLSGYKLPRALTVVDAVPRNATGKAQYPRAKELALAAIAAKHPTTPDTASNPAGI